MFTLENKVSSKDKFRIFEELLTCRKNSHFYAFSKTKQNNLINVMETVWG